MEWIADQRLSETLSVVINNIDLNHIKPSQITFYRSVGSSANAYARIWGLPRIWQQALKLKPHYIIEVISEKFDKLKPEDQIRTLIHELLHIPKSFSGALVPHKGRKHYNVDRRTVEKVYLAYKNNVKK